jgi:lipopolysaccharide biosynthesis protein
MTKADRIAARTALAAVPNEYVEQVSMKVALKALDALDEWDEIIQRLIEVGSGNAGVAYAEGWDNDEWDAVVADAEKLLEGTNGTPSEQS